MARNASSVPPQWRKGVWFIPEIDNNRANWIEFRALKNKRDRTPEEQTRLAELLDMTADKPLAFKLLPYSANEKKSEEQEAMGQIITFEPTKEGGVQIQGKVEDLTKSMVGMTLSKRILEAANYFAPVLDGAGRLTGEQRELVQGPEIVQFVDEETWGDDEWHVLMEAHAAIKSRSVLEAGLGERLGWQRAS